MRITAINRDSIDKIHLFSGESKQMIRTFFESLISIILLDFMEESETNIPFLGTIKLQHTGDKDIGGLKEAEVSVIFTPDPSLLKNVGQITDNEECDVEKMIKMRVHEALRSYLNGEVHPMRKM